MKGLLPLLFLLTNLTAAGSGGGEDCFVRNRNLELLGLVFNTAQGYDPADDDIDRELFAEFCRFYDRFRAAYQYSAAVDCMRGIIERDLIRESDIPLIGILYEEGFEKPVTGYRLPEFMSDPSHPAYGQVRRLVPLLAGLYAEPLVRQFMEEDYEWHYDALLRTSEPLTNLIPGTLAKMSEILKVPLPDRVRIIPVLFWEPYVGYSNTLTAADGHTEVLTIYGPAIDSRTGAPFFNIRPNMIVHEVGHYFVRKALDAAPQVWPVLQRLFTAPAVAGGPLPEDYDDPDSYFNETFTRALELYVMDRMGWTDHDDEDNAEFVYLLAVYRCMMNEMDGSGMDYCGFLPRIIEYLDGGNGITDEY